MTPSEALATFPVRAERDALVRAMIRAGFDEEGMARANVKRRVLLLVKPRRFTLEEAARFASTFPVAFSTPT
jgi:hypothetical protein